MRKEKNKTHNTKYNRGITLIALIITIVVLLILAIVSIGAIKDSNIITHSQTASSKYTIAQEKDTLQLALSEWQLQKNIKDNPKTFKQTIEDALVGEATVGENDPDAGPLTVTFNKTGNKYKVYDDGTITKIDPNSSEPEDIESPEDVKTLADLIEPTNYGDTIEYSANGIDDWKIFYNDGENVFIITSDCIPYDKIPNAVDAEKSEKNDYGVYWTSMDEKERNEINNSVAAKFMAKWVERIDIAPSDAIDVKIASRLMNSNLWSTFVNDVIASEGDAKAIGSPTCEMIAASRNAVFGENKILTPFYDEYGELIGSDIDEEDEGWNYRYVIIPTMLTGSSWGTWPTELNDEKIFNSSTNFLTSTPGVSTQEDVGEGLVTFARFCVVWIHER